MSHWVLTAARLQSRLAAEAEVQAKRIYDQQAAVGELAKRQPSVGMQFPTLPSEQEVLEFGAKARICAVGAFCRALLRNYRRAKGETRTDAIAPRGGGGGGRPRRRTNGYARCSRSTRSSCTTTSSA
jgi:hypothetical protein